MKYKALDAETSGYEDHKEVNKNQRPGMRKRRIGRRKREDG